MRRRSQVERCTGCRDTIDESGSVDWMSLCKLTASVLLSRQAPYVERKAYCRLQDKGLYLGLPSELKRLITPWLLTSFVYYFSIYLKSMDGLLTWKVWWSRNLVAWSSILQKKSYQPQRIFFSQCSFDLLKLNVCVGDVYLRVGPVDNNNDSYSCNSLRLSHNCFFSS